jgi:ABC-type branched-subunit amino acid transport system substrate-binding protein
MRRVLAGVFLLSMVGCGSTVQVRGTATGGVLDDGLGRTDARSSDPLGAPTTPGAPGGYVAPGSSAGRPVGGQVQRPAADQGGLPTTGPVRRTGLKPVQVGFVVAKNNAAVASSLGYKLDNGNEQQVVETLLAAANAAGGLAGHRIVPVWHEVDPATTQTTDEMGQQICARFSDDTRVVAAAGTAIPDTGSACLSGKGIPVFTGSTQSTTSEPDYARMPTVVSMGITARREAAAVVAGAARQEYLAGKPKVGVVSYDNPAFHDAVDSTLLPRLRAAGAQVDSSNVVYGPPVDQTSDLSAVATAMQSAVLRFRGSGVTHVVFATNAAASALVFMQQAESQGARFRYALSSNDAPQVLIDQGVSARQLTGAVAAGWDPYLDVRLDKMGAPPSGRAWCTRALAKLRLAKGSNAEWIAHMHCDAVRLLLAAGARVTGELSSASLAAAIAGIGSLGSANTWSARISADHRWGVAGFRLNRYDGGCGCYSYLDRTTVPV